jgi:hypothetical protein
MERSQKSKGDGSMKILVVLILAMAFEGCTTKYGYMRDKLNAENAAKHPPVFDVATVEAGDGIELKKGAKITVRTPSQPFVPLKFPDELEAQRGIVRDVVTGAVIGFGLHQAGNSTSTKTTVTGGAE